jgi:hypothetical protein
MLSKPYEVLNPSFGDLNIEQQIEYGINDWCAEGRNGHPYYGRTAEEAELVRSMYEAA